MHKRAGLLLLLGASVAAVAAAAVGPIRTPPPPAARHAVPVPVATAAIVQTAPVPSSAVSTSLARWNSLRQSDNLPFSAYASFLLAHRGWPGETAMRRSAERQIQPGVTSSAEIVRFFAEFPPLTPAGHAGHAFALLASGRVDEARETARTAWKAGELPPEIEQRLLGAFGSALGPQDHDARMDVLLDRGQIASARRNLGFTSAQRRPIHEARIALQSRSPDAASRLAGLGSNGAGDPGLLIDRANWLRNTGDPLGARQLLARPVQLTSFPADPAKYMDARVTIARGAVNDRQWSLAYGIASQVDGIYPPGTDVSQKSFDERDEYTNLTWIAGTSAMLRMNRPADAVGMFERYGRAAQSPQTKTKGLYWAGRAAARAGDTARSQALLQEAARHYDQYYGQLAAERLGMTLPAPSAPPAENPTPQEMTAFDNRPIVAAIRYLGQTGNYRDQTAFVRALAEQVRSDRERLMAVQLGARIGRPDLGVLVARAARTDGSFEYKRWGFPQVTVPPAQQRHWTIVHAIARQESLFDRQAVSSAGARGLMQLMPGTAQEVSRRLGVSYEQSRLTSDPQYNVLLGSTYFARLLDQWGGNYPLAVASYNAGAGNVQRWIRANGDPRLPNVSMIDWIEEIPFFETRNYVQRVLENAVVYDLLNPNRASSPSQNRLSFYLGEPQPN